MKKLLISALFSALFLVPLSSEAAESSVVSTITSIMPMAAGHILVTVAINSASCTNANNPKRYMLSVGTANLTAEGLKNIYASILYAASLNKTITVFFEDTNVNCPITRVSVAN